MSYLDNIRQFFGGGQKNTPTHPLLGGCVGEVVEEIRLGGNLFPYIYLDTENHNLKLWFVGSFCPTPAWEWDSKKRKDYNPADLVGKRILKIDRPTRREELQDVLSPHIIAYKTIMWRVVVDGAPELWIPESHVHGLTVR
ncbi:MAG: hypothetical protein AAB798_01370 [Patescibacteria group bacterium]